jgi:tetratricopeptide (TPR) repeat protein
VPGNPVAGRPVVRASLALNYAINRLLDVDQRQDPDGPRKTIGYHLLNLLFHLCSGALLFGVIRRAMREAQVPEDWRALADPVAGIVSALWLLHPIQTEVIDYVVQRTEGLASMFYLAALYGAIRSWDAASASGRLRWEAAALAAAVLGMGSKEIVISVPVAVVLYDRAFRLPTWRAVLSPDNGRRWFYVALSAACVLSFLAFSYGMRGDTAGFTETLTWREYLYSQCWAIAHYLRLVAWPTALAVDYGTSAVHGTRGLPGLVLLSTFGLLTLFAWTRTPRWGWLAFAGSCFFMLLAPSSSIIPIRTEIAAERRVYLALAAVLLVTVVATEWLRRRYLSTLPVKRLFLGWIAVAAAWAAGTAVRNHTYANPETLWRTTVERVPDNLRAYDNLGNALYRTLRPRYAAAESAYANAAMGDTTCHLGCVNLASVMIAQSRFAEAEPWLERALARDPDNVPAERLLALLYMKTQAYERAIPHLEHLAGKYPSEDHMIVLSVAYLSAGRIDAGVTELNATVRRFPGTGLARFGRTLDAAARSPEALPYLQKLGTTMAEKWQ